MPFLKNICQTLSFSSRPRLLIALLLALGLSFFLPEGCRSITKFLVTWDFGTAFYLILVVIMMSSSDSETIQRRSASQDENSIVILSLTVFGAIASLAAIMLELVAARALTGHAQGQAIGLAFATVLLSWIFMQTMFALHYAHAFYGGENENGGLEFPAKYTTPDYWDFVYFAFIIGTAAQTADINITSKTIRRIATAQCVIVFFFNTTILALAINIGAGLAS